ncbi:MAG: hypothetical protein H6741_19190 [Alphaproteobacteria bacterium]|nr:hypothetical protein [Alphaproteobacteria bacterium]
MDLLSQPLPAPLLPANLGLLTETLRLHPWGTLLPLLVQAALTILVLRAARAQGRRPNLGGWLLGPAAGVLTAALTFALCGLDDFGWPALCMLGEHHHPYMFFEPHLAQALLHLALALGAAGLQLGLHSALARRGLSAALGLGGAGLVAAAALTEAHRVELSAWFMSTRGGAPELWPQVEDAWQLKVWILRYAVLLGVLLSLAVWRRRAELAPSPTEGLRAVLLTFGVIAALGLAWVVVDQGSRRGLQPGAEPWARPTTLAPAARPMEPAAPFPHRSAPLGALEVRFSEGPP